MRVTVLGASPSFPNPGGASSSYLIEHESTRVLVDCGHGSCSRLVGILDPRSLDGVVLSHLHPDHFFDLVPLVYAMRFRYMVGPRVPLWLPPGGRSWLERFFAAADLGAEFLERSFDVGEYRPGDPLAIDTVRIEFAPTRHYVRGYAMRFSSPAGSSPVIGYSSDTGPSEAVTSLLHRADLAIVEASLLEYAPEESFHGHMTAREAGRLAHRAEICNLLLTHYEESQAEELCRQAQAEYSGPIALAREGTTYEA